MNPFHMWLGLPEKSANPNHYQLLGIKSNERDGKVIEQAARQRLAQLKTVTPNENQTEAFEKIKQRIIKAHAVLHDDAKRAQYDAKLSKKLAEQKQEQAAATSASGTSHPNIPMAVPIAGQTPVEEVPSAAPIGDSDSFSFETVQSAKFKRKKKSWLVPVFCLILCLGGIGGLTYVVINLDAIRGTGAPPLNPDTEDVVVKLKAKQLAKPEDVPPAESIDPKETDPNLMPADLSSPGSPKAKSTASDMPPPNVTFEKLDFGQLVEFRRHMENARRALYRRNSMMADNEIQNAQAFFRRFEKDDIALEQSQVPLEEMADATAAVKLLLEGFWKQVIASSIKLPAGQPIEVADRTLGFVEGTERFVILRIDGTNVTFDYEFLPPAIAMVLAEQGDIEDLATYRMQKAACYAVHTHLDPKFEQRAEELANRAAGDGHDPEPILRFVSFDLADVGVPAERAAQPSESELRALVPKQMVRLGFDDFRKMRPEQASLAVPAALEAAVTEKDDSRRAVSFEVAYKLAAKAGDIRVVNDVLAEYRLWTDFDYGKRVRQAFTDVSKADLDDRKARFLMNAMIAYGAVSEDKRFNKKLMNIGKNVARQYRLDDQLRRLENATGR